jgi:hypothetical protein
LERDTEQLAVAGEQLAVTVEQQFAVTVEQFGPLMGRNFSGGRWRCDRWSPAGRVESRLRRLAESRPATRYRYAHNGLPSAPGAFRLST